MNTKRISRHVLTGIILSCLLLLKYIIKGAVIIVPLLSALPGVGNEAGSIGIIGGMDGPTAIFISSAYSFLFILPVIEFAAIIYICIVLFRCYRLFRNS